MSFSVTIIGCGSAVPTSKRGLTSQYIQCSNRHLLIDCGEGTQMKMRGLGIKFQKIEHIFISHLHGDHYFGLVGMLSTMQLLGRSKEVHVYSHKGLREVIELQLLMGGARLSFPLVFHDLEVEGNGVLWEDEKILVRYFPLSHGIPTSGFVVVEKEKDFHLLAEKAIKDGVKIAHYHRLKKGEDVLDESGTIFRASEYTVPSSVEKRYAFCSDTRFDERIVPFIENVDVLYHEATFTMRHADRAKSTFHSTALEAATIAQKANVKRLVLGHLSARYDSVDEHLTEAKSGFEAVEVAEDGMVIRV